MNYNRFLTARSLRKKPVKKKVKSKWMTKDTTVIPMPKQSIDEIINQEVKKANAKNKKK